MIWICRFGHMNRDYSVNVGSTGRVEPESNGEHLSVVGFSLFKAVSLLCLQTCGSTRSEKTARRTGWNKERDKTKFHMCHAHSLEQSKIQSKNPDSIQSNLSPFHSSVQSNIFRPFQSNPSPKSSPSNYIRIEHVFLKLRFITTKET